MDRLEIPHEDVAMQKQHARIMYEAVAAYIGKAEKPFTYDEICDEMEARFQFLDPDAVIEFIELSLKLNPHIVKVENAPEDPLFTPANVFYKGASFCLALFDEGVEGGSFFPGFMFQPYISEELTGTEASIRPEDCEIEIGRKTARISFSELSLSCYNDSFGMSLVKNAKELFTAERPNDDINADIYDVEVYDLKEYFEKVSFSEGDVLVFTVEDYFGGKLKFHRLAKEERHRDIDKCVEWSLKYFEALKRVADKDGFGTGLYVQLQDVFLDNPGLLANPLFSLQEVMIFSEELIFVENHDDLPAIWRKGKPLPKDKSPDGK
ncbi:MAG TPA: hypothetical protein DCZ94_04155 [Lentisphaeria bacterium]|nr:MAG: hypothetical protein A2X48_05375 [Lentisphaerae bacterium GWF2_49_21]HBC86129.1 hypothetical protein [Lentisphaeria bacterium]